MFGGDGTHTQVEQLGSALAVRFATVQGVCVEKRIDRGHGIDMSDYAVRLCVESCRATDIFAEMKKCSIIFGFLLFHARVLGENASQYRIGREFQAFELVLT